MRRRTRTGIRRNADARPSLTAQEIRRQRLSPGTPREERVWRTARLPESSLDDLFQRGFTQHEPTCWQRLAERNRPTANREGLRFSSSLAHRFALCHRTRHRHSASQLAGTNRQTAKLLFWQRSASQRNAHARLLRAHAKYLSGDRTYYRTIRKRARHEQDPFSFQFSSINTAGQNSAWRVVLYSQ